MVNYAQSIENSSPEEQKDISEKMTQLQDEIVKLEKKDSFNRYIIKTVS